jgi:hypothetical protein
MEAIEIVLAVLHICGAVHWTPAHKKAECLVFHSGDELATAWLADGGRRGSAPVRYDEVGEMRVFAEGGKEPPPPPINFEKEMVVAVFAGQKPTGGYSVKVEKVVYAAGRKTVWVVYSEKAPGPDAMTTQVLTYPSHVVAVTKVEGEVKFVKSESEEARKLEEMLKAAKTK